VAGPTSTTIRGVSILSRQKKRSDDSFDLVLSRQGIEVRRPERPVQQMSWERVSEWEIEECKGYVLLTLRGQGATTPLVVPGWTLDDLEIVMREVTSGGPPPEPAEPAQPAEPDEPEPVIDTNDGRSAAAVAVVAPSAPAQTVRIPEVPEPPTGAAAPVPLSRMERRQRNAQGAWRRRLSWRAVVTVVLLGVLAAAVILVLLQSAGIIDWGFLGPVA
jgi:hypothetical protein